MLLPGLEEAESRGVSAGEGDSDLPHQLGPQPAPTADAGAQAGREWTVHTVGRGRGP